MRNLLAVFVTTLVLCLAHAASAQPAASDEEARMLFRAGAAAYNDGRFEEAYERFLRAYELSQRPTLLYNVGVAADRAGRDEDALRTYEQYLEQLPEAENRAYVVARVEVLRRRVAPTQTPPPTDVPAHPPADDAPAHEATHEATPETTPSAPPHETAAATPSEADHSSGAPVLPIVLFSAAGVTGIAAIITGLSGLSIQSDLDDMCPDHRCTDPSLEDRADDMTTFAITTDVLAVASLGFATAGLLTLVLGGDDDDERDSVAVSFSPSGATLRGAF